MKKFATIIISAALLLATSITPMAATVDLVHPTVNTVGICDNCKCYRPLVEVVTESVLFSVPECGICCDKSEHYEGELMPDISTEYERVICITTLCETCANKK